MGAKFKGVVLETLQTRDTSYIACLNEVDLQRLQWFSELQNWIFQSQF